jgi:hypothetical protein
MQNPIFTKQSQCRMAQSANRAQSPRNGGMQWHGATHEKPSALVITNMDLPRRRAPATMTSAPTQEEVDHILGAALDALDDLDGSDSDDQQDTCGTTGETAAAPQPSAATSIRTEASGAPPGESEQASTQNKVYYGPEPPPVPCSATKTTAAAAAKKQGESSPSASLEDAMSQLLRAGEALQKSAASGGDVDNIDLDGAEKMLDDIMGQLQLGGLGELMGGLDDAGNDKSIKETTTKKADNMKKEEKYTAAEDKASDNKYSATKEPPTSSALKSKDGSNSTQADVDRAVQRLLSDMAKAGSDDDDAIPDLDAMMNGMNMDAMGEEMMESMMKELSAFGASGDADDVVDGMMRQLLSKELMYEPMKQVCDRFPAWLAESKAHLSQEEYQK